ncbi:Diacylglycerol kinase catalytic domain-containing protein [Nitrosomonas marina]|uniref:Diacylglycerol kinase catalytic domain-containing protein n=1 Tax=Nitrosomonas marina TaxID=917 RepID=A0A1I0D0Q1_9PROT|nr:acylglycerol kinase family protein [Nitrosomonas marina]SET25464.1 Diacylglycerol kinase catalytic domain-containing protein [Nitrosomonas marina]
MTVRSASDLFKSTPVKIGLLLNPMSGKVRKREQAIRQTLAQIPNAMVCEATDLAGFITATDTLIQTSPDILVIIAGDGTSHAVLSHLFSTLPIAQWPALMIVPGGTTNMTPLDLGMRGKPEKILQRLAYCLQHPDNNELFQHVQRPVLCIEQNGQQTIYGMFFAAGLVARGVKFSRSSVKQIGITGGIFTFLIMLRSLIGLIFSHDNKEWAPVKMSIVRENGEKVHGTYLFTLISALDCLLLNLRPYWGKELAPLHVTWVDQQRKHLWRSLWSLLKGQGERLNAEDGYHSHNSHALTIQMNDEYIVDGELYRSPDNEPLRITATPPVTFLVL